MLAHLGMHGSATCIKAWADWYLGIIALAIIDALVNFSLQ